MFILRGIWKNTLLEDLKWLVDPSESFTHPQLPTGIPSWSWASVKVKETHPFPQRARIYVEDSLDHLPSRCKASVTFSAVGPPQLGNVADAAILLENRSYMGLLQWSYNSNLAVRNGMRIFYIAPQYNDI
jgi:hypothetical protein